MLALGCESSEGGATAVNVAQRLTDSVKFALGELIDGGLPDATDSAVELVELGPATLLTPGGSELLAFDLADPQGRPVTAILLQFEDEDKHLRGEVEEGGGSTTTVVSGELEVEDTLCQGLCDGVLSVSAKVAVELEDGAISEALEIDVAIDCRGEGTTGECTIEDGADPDAPALVCQDVTQGGAALTNDPQLDAYFDALRTLALYSEQTEAAAQMSLTTIRNALGPDAQEDGIPPVLESEIEGATEAGLLVLIGDPGCATRAQRVQHTLRVCDREVTSEQATVACEGLCEPGADRNACMDAGETGCRGVIRDGECGGVCWGACQVELAEPRACVGTCIGTCDGSCDGGGPGACEGPCTGMCDGECREPISEACDGLCTGFCDEASEDALPTCASPLKAYCSSAGGDTLTCNGDCFGTASIDQGAPICQASALAIGHLSARCDAPVVQIYFAFNPDAESDEQLAFATLVETINDPITNLLVLLERIDLLEAAASELLGVADGPVADRVAAQLEGVQAESLECAEDVIDTTTPWLSMQVDLMRDLREEILAIAAVLDTTGL